MSVIGHKKVPLNLFLTRNDTLSLIFIFIIRACKFTVTECVRMCVALTINIIKSFVSI